MVKILHTSDVQLDAPFGFLGNKGAVHRQQLRETFAEIVRLAKDDEYDVLLIAGDLFDSNSPAHETVQFVIRELGQLKIPTFILPGNHDCYDERSVYRKYVFPDRVYIVDERQLEFELPQHDLTIAASPVLSRTDKWPPLKGIERPPKAKLFVIMAHGNLQIPGLVNTQERAIKMEDIANSGADYVALGDWHSYGDFSQDNVKTFYSGAPEPMNSTQSGAGFVASITLAEDGVTVAPIKVGKIGAKKVEIDVRELSEAQISERIWMEADSSLMLTVTLTGLTEIGHLVDAAGIQDSLGGDFYYLRVSDQSSAALEQIDAADFPETHVIGQYVRILQQEIEQAGTERERRIAEQALQLGVAQLQGKEVLR